MLTCLRYAARRHDDCRCGQGNNCNVLIVRCRRQSYRETGRKADGPRSGRPRVTTPAQNWYIRTSHLRGRYRMATTTARNRLREAGLRACRPVVRQVLTRSSPDLTGNNVAYGHKPTFTGPDRTGKMCSSLTSRGFVSPGVMVGFAFIIEGMSITPRPVLCSRIDLEVEGPSWSGAACHSINGLSLSLQAISQRCAL